MVDILVGQGYQATVYDNLSNGRREFIEHHLGEPNFRFVEGDILDEDRLAAEMEGHDLVWHLAANTDIIGGVEQPRRDLRDCVMGTFNVLEAMRRTGIRPIIFSSTGAVYGELCHDVATSESDGPLLAGLDVRGGQDRQRGVHLGVLQPVRPARLDVPVRQRDRCADDARGHLRLHPQAAARTRRSCSSAATATQEKNYFLVEECIDGMAYAYRNIPMTEDKPCDVFNLGTDSVTRVVEIAQDREGGDGTAGCPDPHRGHEAGVAGRSAEGAHHRGPDAPARLDGEVDFGPGGADRGAPHAGQGVDRLMNVCVIGLWHQGIVGAACLADLGYSVVAADHDTSKVALLNNGQGSPFRTGARRADREGAGGRQTPL